MSLPDALPVDAVLPALCAALERARAAVLVAPPGAGKTTRVPLVLAQQPWAMGKKILLLEPRRLAAGAAAERMAASLGEEVGATVGLRVRFGSRVSAGTRIEVVTEGVFSRLILDDPELRDVAAVLFDEFHERSLDADLGLALARDVQTGLRDDLRIVVMSATLEAARVGAVLGGAPLIEASGRAFPVETRYLGRDPRRPIEGPVADAILDVLHSEPGSVLAFLPGAAEIRRAERLLTRRLTDPTIAVVGLYGALDADTQRRAIAPAPAGTRKVVLATSIAETSLTIQGVRVVVDSGLSRVPRYEPDVGLTRLETVRVSRASADQRRGRAGRNGPGVCVRLWDEPQTASLDAYNKPEMLTADLSSLVLDLASWGLMDPGGLALLDRPPAAAWAAARAMLRDLDAIDDDGRITELGGKLRRLPLPPRLSRMLLDAAAAGAGLLASEIAVVLTERGLGGREVDLRDRLEAFRADRSRQADEARRMARRWAESATWSGEPSRNGASALSPGAVLSLAYPDRIARSRGHAAGAFLLANGRGASLEAGSRLAAEPYLAVAEVAGAAAHSRILLAAPITLAEIEMELASRVTEGDELAFDPESASLRGRRCRRLGALILAERPVRLEPGAETAMQLAAGIALIGLSRLPWTRESAQFRDRVMFLRRIEGEDWPDLSDAALTATVAEWLAPALVDKTALAQLSADEFAAALGSCVAPALRRRLDVEAPTHVVVPSGSRLAIDYAAEAGPTLSVRVQELFGLSKHPSLARGRVPLVVELLSPAHRPVQVTRDLPGFWRGSYQAVRTEMRGRYPRHPWPDDPMAAAPTRRAKPRGS
jgi:ATP-dependent helicase HrpB